MLRVFCNSRTAIAPGAIFRAFLLASVGVVLMPRSAAGGGFDSPILYTARHQGMGGAAIGYVDDPSAVFHNPAGLQGVHGFSLLGDVSLLFINVTGSPLPRPQTWSMQSDLNVAPFFLGAVAYRVLDGLTLGLGAFPVAAGGAEYEYVVAGGATYQTNATSLTFFEVTPVLSLNVPKDAFLPGELAFGIGYRASMVSFQREISDNGLPRSFYLDLSGRNLKGFRAGAQYRPGRAFSIGAVYRNRVTYTSQADEGTISGQSATDVELPFVLPAQAGGGLRVDAGPFGLASDVVYTFQSQNERADLTGRLGEMPFVIPTVYDWQDAYTLHFGIEYRLGPLEEVPIRLGYVFDGQVADRRFPTAFGIPPASTNTFSLGGGYTADSWKVNLAVTLSDGGTTLDDSNLDSSGACATCGFAGEYRISATGVYIDFSTEIGR